MSNNSNMFCQPCAVCGETYPDLFRIWFDGYVKLYRCLKCGFVSQFPGPGKFTIVTKYEDFYSLDFLNKNQEFMYPERRRVLQNIVDRIANIKATGEILDVGCGDGHFLYLCAQRGFNCYGVEDSTHLSSYASTKARAKVIQGLYNREMFPGNFFDIITFIQVLEHIPTPINALETARYHLRPGGILVIEIPSIHSPHFLAYQLTGIKKFVKPPDGVIYSHVGYYKPKSFLVLSKKCGFKTVSLVTGRWRYKYSGYLRLIGLILDPLFNVTKIGGILYIGTKDG